MLIEGLKSLLRPAARVVGLAKPLPAKKPWRDPAQREQIIDNFHGLYYDGIRRGETWGNTFFMGIKVEKCPMDLWLHQELIFASKPDVIVETGTRFGGSALWFASLCDLVGKGRVVTVDIDDTVSGRPVHPRITYVHGSSADSALVDSIRDQIGAGETVMVVLDSDHGAGHVLAELRLFAELVTPDSYLVVEDTNINGHPVIPEFGPGPMEALDQFLQEDRRFEVDKIGEKFYLTFNPRGVLRKRKATA
ncbi:CmcI family methyltransferase [Arenimonas sp.]|uniref:CmcI family methyltransferase n=1 Tax=Arenimonas sp. TaxID=1872635 RepID=UPI0039E639A3